MSEVSFYESGVHFAEYLEIMESLRAKGLTAIGRGSYRVVYARATNSKTVIKVPRNLDGEYDNIIEARAWRELRSTPSHYGIRLAPCRLLPDKSLMMVRVEKAPYEVLPAWAKKIDGAQVGYYRGKLVAYDYASDLAERFDWEEELGFQGKDFKTKGSMNGAHPLFSHIHPLSK